MFGYFLFGLTVLVYIVISLFVLQPAPSGSDQYYGWSSSALVLIAAYGVCSLLLRINITANGGFNWISDAAFKRNGIVAILWLGMVAGFTTVKTVIGFQPMGIWEYQNGHLPELQLQGSM
jgi:hypothetical protein